MCQFYHYIEKATGLEVYRRALMPITDRRQKELELYYALPLDGLKYPIPAGFELWVDGMLVFTVEFDQVEVNRGLASYLFKQPTEN